MEIKIDNVGSIEIPSENAELTKFDEILSEILRVLLDIQEQTMKPIILIKEKNEKIKDELDIQEE